MPVPGTQWSYVTRESARNRMDSLTKNDGVIVPISGRGVLEFRLPSGGQGYLVDLVGANQGLTLANISNRQMLFGIER